MLPFRFGVQAAVAPTSRRGGTRPVGPTVSVTRPGTFLTILTPSSSLS